MRDELIQWLLDCGYAEVQSGYGHVSGAVLADALLKEWVITGRKEEGTCQSPGHPYGEGCNRFCWVEGVNMPRSDAPL